MIQPWPKIRSERVGDFRVFTVRRDYKTSPRTGREHDFYVIDAVNWVNIIALTPDRHAVMVEQYRHGTDTIDLEIPGGVMDPSETDPVATACRELREETGYVGDNARIIGSVAPKPAIMSNTCYTILVENCHPTGQLHFDPAEDIVTRLIPLDDLPRLITEGKIRHSLIVAALYQYQLACNGAPKRG